jgi:hypothetical protein
MPGTLHQFDRSLYEQKLLEPSVRMQNETRQRWRQVQSQIHKRGNIAGLVPSLIDSAFDVLRKYLDEIDRICRDVWRVQGKAETPEFVREVIRDYAVFGAIAARCAGIQGEMTLLARRMRHTNLAPALHHLQREKGHLENIVSNRYEVEARELTYKTALAAEPRSQNGPSGGFEVEQQSLRGLIEDAERDTVLWLQADPSAEERLYVYGMQAKLGELSRIVTHRIEGRGSPTEDGKFSEIADEVLSLLRKAKEVRGSIVGRVLARLAERLPQVLLRSRPGQVTKAPPPIRPVGPGLTPYHPKPTEIPPNPPIRFPSDFWPETQLILAKAVREFPDQTKTLGLCKHVVSKMTPVFIAAVEAKAMQAGAVIRENGGGMEDLLHTLLVYNCGHADQRYDLAAKVRNSDEWLNLLEAIKATRTRDADSAKSKAENSAVLTTREPFLRPILDQKGFSIHDWAKKANVDFHTANDYLTGKTKPHPNTLKKLADALGLKVASLPK